MPLTEEQRNILIELEIEKGRKMLLVARQNLDLRAWETVANRLYYACFHHVSCLLLQDGIICKSHSGVMGQFGKSFIKTGILPEGLAGILRNLWELRHRGDYDYFMNVSEEEVRNLMQPAEEFCIEIENLIRSRQNEGDEK